VALCVDDAESGRMVVAYGRALLVDDGIWELTRRLVEKYIHDRDAVQAHMERIFSNWTRVILKVRPDRIIIRNLD